MDLANLNNLSEWEKIGLSFTTSVVLSLVIFYNESWIVLFKTVFILFWMFVLPGIGITYLFGGLSFAERFAASVAISAVLVGATAYYLGILGVHVKYSAVILPAIFTAVS